jgi:hypothetical protein
VEDDFFHENNEVFFEAPTTSSKANRKPTKMSVKSEEENEDEELVDDSDEEQDELDEEFEDLAINLDCRSEFSTESTTSSSESQSNNLIDDDTKIEAFRHIIAGACMSMGLKFAGTFNNEAYQTLVSNFFLTYI